MCFTNTQTGNDTYAICVRLPPPPHICDLIKYEWMNSNHWIHHMKHTYAQLTRAIFWYQKQICVKHGLDTFFVWGETFYARRRNDFAILFPFYASFAVTQSMDCAEDLLLCNRRCLQPARTKLITMMMHTINGNRWRHPPAEWYEVDTLPIHYITHTLREQRETFWFCFVFGMSINPFTIWLLYRRWRGGRGSNNKNTLAIWRLTCICVAMKLEEM